MFKTDIGLVNSHDLNFRKLLDLKKAILALEKIIKLKKWCEKCVRVMLFFLWTHFQSK
jgi:hypothetical protein